jgi:CRISPR/Cas system CMR-associated protein Cmr5 small subunit
MLKALHETAAATFCRATEETLALLRWIRQFAAAISGE